MSLSVSLSSRAWRNTPAVRHSGHGASGGACCSSAFTVPSALPMPTELRRGGRGVTAQGVCRLAHPLASNMPTAWRHSQGRACSAAGKALVAIYGMAANNLRPRPTGTIQCRHALMLRLSQAQHLRLHHATVAAHNVIVPSMARVTELGGART